MYFKYYLLSFYVLFIASCSNYIGDYKDVYYYKYNNIPKTGSYTLVLNNNIDAYSNFKYSQIAEKIKDNLNASGFIEVKEVQQSNYLVYYDYSVVNKKNIYNVVLSVKIFDTKNMVNVFDEQSSKVSKKNKMIFDASSVLYTSQYLPSHDIDCLVNAIFKTQVMSKNKTINIKSKISKEEININNAEGTYYCLA